MPVIKIVLKVVVTSSTRIRTTVRVSDVLTKQLKSLTMEIFYVSIGDIDDSETRVKFWETKNATN